MATMAPGRMSTTYFGFWMTMMAVALAYMGALAVRPELIADWLPPVKLAAMLTDADEQAQAEQTSIDIDRMREQLQQAKAELMTMRTELSRQAEREATLANKVAALEAREVLRAQQAEMSAAAAPATKTAAVAKALAAKSKSAAPAAQADATDAQAVQIQLPPGAMLQLTQQRPSPPAAKPAGPGETASILPRPATAFGSTAVVAVKPAQSEMHAVVLMTGPSVDTLRANWMLLSDRNQDALGSLQPRYTAAGETNGLQAYNLLAGPIPSAAEAAKVCEDLRARKVNCRVGTYSGNAL